MTECAPEGIWVRMKDGKACVVRKPKDGDVLYVRHDKVDERVQRERAELDEWLERIPFAQLFR